MVKNKRKLIIIIAAAIVVIAIAAGTTLFLLNNSNTNKSSDTPTTAKANSLKEQAIEALKNKDSTTAKKLFEEAQKDYKSLGDTNNIVDTEAQLYLINNQ